MPKGLGPRLGQLSEEKGREPFHPNLMGGNRETILDDKVQKVLCGRLVASDRAYGSPEHILMMVEKGIAKFADWDRREGEQRWRARGDFSSFKESTPIASWSSDAQKAWRL
jgi:hypothetical protein